MPLSMSSRWTSTALLVPFLFVSSAVAHGHHDEPGVAYENNFVEDGPVDGTLKLHIAVQVLCWGLLFPLGMVLGITRSRWHVPLQSTATVLSLFGNWLAHHHGGREFHTTAHSRFASVLKYWLVIQAALGVFLKLHIWEGTRTRRAASSIHGVMGKCFPVLGWTQMIFGGIATLGFCFGEHFGQCLAHFIMGSSFILYAVFMLIMMRLGASFLARHKLSQEMLDSTVICLWGIVNTFTEHDFLRKSGYWSHKDLQHTSLGVLWWAGGALGMYLGRNGRRNVIPALIIIFTGYAMSAHEQSMEYSTTVHRVFGWVLMTAGLTRIIEIVFILKDGPSPPRAAGEGAFSAFQHLPPYLLTLAGLTFLSATEEQLAWVSTSGLDSTTYANGLFSLAFILYLTVAAMIETYERLAAAKDRREFGADSGDLEEGARQRLPSRPSSWSPLALFGALVALFSSSSSHGGIRGGGDAERARLAHEYESLTGEAAQRPHGSTRSSSHDSEPDSLELAERHTQTRRRSNGTIFEVGEEDEDDDGGDDYWKEETEK